MAGILANSATVTMTSGDTATDKSVSGYLSQEAIGLTTSPAPAGATYLWAVSKPSGATSKSSISDDSAAAPSFTPDVAGYWVVTCTVNSSTDYVIRISVTQVAQSTTLEALRVSPKPTASVPAPAVGLAVFVNSSDQDLLTRKTPDGALLSLEQREITPTGAGDVRGNIGDIGYDANYIYVKCPGVGWKRAALTTF